MSEPLRAMADDELGDAVSSLDLAWPATPDLVPAVMGRLLIAAAATLLLGGAAVAAKLLIDLGAVVVRVTPGPNGAPSAPPTSFGAPIDLERAADLLGDEVRVPAALGAPDRVWADRVITDAGRVIRVTLAWAPRPGLPVIRGSEHGAVLMRFEGDEDQAFKDVYEDTGTVEPARVAGVEAVWTTGRHLLELLTGDGIRYLLVEGNVLLWRDGPYTLRLETSLPKAEAIRIAESLRGTT
jgi:hypothetical protein